MTDSLSMRVARYAAATSIDAVPEGVRERTRQIVFDEIACAWFGRRSAAGDITARYAMGCSGPGESRILGTRRRVSAPYAALANGTAGHGEEVDGAHVVGGHPGATIVHAALAVAERQRASGAELLNAVVLGYDIGTRLIEACGGTFAFKNRCHLQPDFLHAIAAAVAASRLLRLDPVRHCHAMALSTFQANGLWALFQEKRHISKSFCNGQYAFAGVSAALMSAAGLEGCEDILATRDGLLDAWGVQECRDAITHRLGEAFAVMGANFKFANAGYPIHAALEAVMTLVARHGLHIDAIESVQVGMPENAMRVVDNRHMHSICLQDVIAAALLRDGLKLRESPFPAVLGDPAFAGVRARIGVHVDPVLQKEQPDGRGANVTIATKDGGRVMLRIDHPRGHSLRGGPAWSDLAAKWRDGLPDHDVDRLLTLAQRLEELDDVRELADALDPATRSPQDG